MKRFASLLLTVLWACSAPQPPSAPHALVHTRAVAASFGRTWDVLIDQLAAANIPIQTMDRASGFIATARVEGALADTVFADCGTVRARAIRATSFNVNFVVRGDSSITTVRATMGFYSGPGAMNDRCESRGVMESVLESALKAQAEGTDVEISPAFASLCSIYDVTSRDGKDLIAEIHTPTQQGCLPHHCQYRGGARSMRPEDAIAKCKAEAAAADSARLKP